MRLLGVWPATLLMSAAAGQVTPLSPPELTATLGRSGKPWGLVRAVTFSKDGRTAARADGNLVFVLDAATLKERAVLAGHSDTVTAVDISPDGKVLASADSKSLRLWDLAGEPPKLRSEVGVGGIYGVAFTGDGKRLASAAFTRGGPDSDAVRLWDLTADPPKFIRVPDATAGGAYSAMFLDNDRTLAVGGSSIRLWDVTVDPPKLRHTLAAASVWMAVSPDGKTLAAVGNDYTVRLYDVSVDPPIAKATLGNDRRGQLRPYNGVAFSPDGKLLAAGTAEVWFRVWDLSGDKPVDVAVPPRDSNSGAVRCLAFARTGTTLVMAGSEIRAWDFAGVKPTLRTDIEGGGADAPIAWMSDGKLLCRTGAHKATVWDLSGASPREQAVIRLEADGKPFRTMMQASGRTLVSGGVFGIGKVTVHEVGDAGATRRAEIAGTPVALSGDGRTLVVATRTDLEIWDLSADPPKVRVKLPAVQPTFAAFASLSADGRTLALGVGRTMQVWNLAGDKPELRTTVAGASAVLSPDGSRLVTFTAVRLGPRFTPAGSDAGVLWDVSGAEAKRLAELGAINAAAFSPDGKTIAGADALALKLFDREGKTVKTIGIAGSVAELRFSPDGTRLATANANGTVFVLRVADGK